MARKHPPWLRPVGAVFQQALNAVSAEKQFFILRRNGLG